VTDEDISFWPTSNSYIKRYPPVSGPFAFSSATRKTEQHLASSATEGAPLYAN